MPGLILRSVLSAGSPPVRMPSWRQLLLLSCLVIPGHLALADTDSATEAAASQSATEAGVTAIDEPDGVLSGLDITRRVLGGEASARDDWPSVVALARPGTSSLYNRFYCGGTLVAERWVMTAAHCLYNAFGSLDATSSMRVVAGVHDLVEDEGVQEHVVANIFVHPDYDNSLSSPPNDIALLELATAPEVEVGQLFVEDSEDYTGTIGYIVGWGATRYLNANNADYPAIQQEAPVPLVSLETCNSPISYNGIITVTQQCAGYALGEIDTCAGDSGGPLYIIENGEVQQVGITSFGSGCGEENFYGIYTNVSHYIPWIGTYIDVPEQSAELIAAREAAVNGTDSDGGDDQGIFGAATNPLYLLLLVIAGLARQFGSRTGLSKGEFKGLAKPVKTGFMVTTVALLTSACAVPAIWAQNDEASYLTAGKEMDMSNARQWVLNESNLRAGVNGWQLGAERNSLVDELTQLPWMTTECKTGKTALRGTGRLFETEHCSATIRSAIALNGRQVHSVNFYLLDRELVRIDLALGQPVTASESEPESLSESEPDLSAVLASRYGQSTMLSEVSTAQAEATSTSMEWRSDDDLIQLYADQSLHFVDGRLESNMPILFSAQPPFGEL